MRQYLAAIKKVMDEGRDTSDRTGVGTRSLFGMQMRFDLSDGFPAVTAKRLAFKSVVAELLWFLSGSTNNNDLREMGCTIWDEWARDDGELGPIYGKQWRNFGGVDQIVQLIDGLRTNQYSRRHIVSPWNPVDIPDMALPPCHALFQFHVTGGKLSCQLYQRSADMFLGVPFNIASYALLTHMIARQVVLIPGEFIWTGGDCHIYANHMEQVAEMLRREPRPLPELSINRHVKSIFDYRPEDFSLVGYDPHPAISAPVAV